MSPSPETTTRVIISGGGTGGHIFPAIAIANALRAIDPAIQLLFVGAEGKMEMEKVPAAGYSIKGLPIAGIKREFSLDNLSFPLKLLRSLSKAGDIIKDFNPQAAVGVGGYASGPLLYMASRRGIPALVQEQNSFPGITNKMLARKAKKICVAYEGMDRFFPAEKIVFTGNPVREDIKQIDGKRAEAAAFFGVDPGKRTLLVVGGSQGARSINKAMRDGLNEIAAAGIQLIWQTGKPFHPEAKQAVDALNNPGIRVFDFITRMDLGYAIADAVVARAGASTVSELCIVKKPAILVPLPTAAEDHQTKNCMALVERNAGLLVKDDQAAGRLVSEAIRLINDEQLCHQLAENIAPLARPDAAQQIAREVLAMIKK
ncbi:MAG: undecaprenyldiphospho-muramoylpentapeptide beta-N-acetylglucosaminyltransferase [Bacteroidia bacterium]|nr:undecaprenyldiphospho-muramoylpentapeptide beta-N-acetylglucosaminyltransferase [Bacteroidia bacterium]